MKLYLRLVWASIRARLQYKFDFLASTFVYAFITALDFMTVAIILHRYNYIAGWNLYEVGLLAGIMGSAFGLYRTFAAELDTFERYLIGGEFDTLLIRPWPTVASLLARNFDLGRMGALLQGLVILVICARGVMEQGAPTWLWVYLFLLPVAGFFIMTAISLATAALGFWIIRVQALNTFTVSAPTAAASYPMDIYPRWLRWLLTGVLPVATFVYIPVQYALGKGGSPWSLVVPFAAAPVAFFVALRLWHWGQRHYQSAGG